MIYKARRAEYPGGTDEIVELKDCWTKVSLILTSPDFIKQQCTDKIDIVIIMRKLQDVQTTKVPPIKIKSKWTLCVIKYNRIWQLLYILYSIIYN